MNAQTSDGEVAPAAMTVSVGSPGNASCVHLPPRSCQAIGPRIEANWLPNAHPVVFPVAATAVKAPPGVTDLTMCHFGAGAALAAGAASASSPAAAAAAVSHARPPRIVVMRDISSDPPW